MKYAKISIGTKKDICAVMLFVEGKLVSQKVEKIRDEQVLRTSNATLIYAVSLGIRVIKNYIQTEVKEDISVVFEVNNSSFIKWVENSYSKPEYQKEFEVMLNLLNELPILYDFVYVRPTKAYSITDEKYIETDKISSDLEDKEEVHTELELSINEGVGKATKISGLDEFL